MDSKNFIPKQILKMDGQSLYICLPAKGNQRQNSYLLTVTFCT